MGGITNIFQGIRPVGVIFPQAIKDNAEWVGSAGSTPVNIDTRPGGVKFNSARVMFMVGATDVTVATLKIQESDSESSGYADVVDLKGASGFVGGAPGPSDDNKFFAVVLDLRKRKRYLRVSAVAGNGTTGTYMACWVDLGDPTEVPDTDALRNVEEMLLID